MRLSEVDLSWITGGRFPAGVPFRTETPAEADEDDAGLGGYVPR